ncbi:TPA: hypothetical protein N0F65_001246 [Lagenidium giganteum]|uniref:Uncharacterized protein n=1 Tax=Lagenidium giganteum TaxID=4803 RepID=A0AAV2YV25_9STRA|nr:TPA: hypothetical protein N0F65_001246 [Lagenidium giganteum]
MRSALCVTSLYDTYLALQRENATLRGELEHLRQETALATAKQAALRDPEVEDGPEQEVRLLQTEKLQLTARFEKSKAQLQRQLDEYKALYAQQLHKYQQKYAVDPHEDKRVAISVKSLQDALEKTSQQKDELAMRYQRLQQMHHELEAAHGRLQEALAQHEAELAQKKSQHTHRLLRQVLERWVLGRTSRAWKQWTMVVMAYRLEGKRQQEVAQLTSESNAQLERIRAHKAALIAAKWLQSSRLAGSRAVQTCTSAEGRRYEQQASHWPNPTSDESVESAHQGDDLPSTSSTEGIETDSRA